MASRVLSIALIPALLSFLVFGCATSRGFSRDVLRGELNDKTEVTDEEISKALALKPQLPAPFSVGVYFKGPNDASRYGRTTFHWSEADKEKILKSADALKESGQISKIFVISPTVTSGTDLKSLRLAAAQHGADALLVVSGVQDVDAYHNSWSWTYIALATMLFVPANKTDVLFMTRASLWDVRNQFLYMTAEAESTKSQPRPAASADERKLLGEAKEESVNKISFEIARMAEALSKQKQAAAVSGELQPATSPKIFRSNSLNKSPVVPISM